MTDPACGLCNDREKYPTGVVIRGCPVHDPIPHVIESNRLPVLRETEADPVVNES